MQKTLDKDGPLDRESETEVVLVGYLEKKLVVLNPGLPESDYQYAIRKIVETSASQSMLVTNRKKTSFIRKAWESPFATKRVNWSKSEYKDTVPLTSA